MVSYTDGSAAPFSLPPLLTYIPHYGQSLSLGTDPDGSEIVSLAGSATSITGATQANPVVITATAHGLTDGSDVYFIGVGGMTQINQHTYEVANATTNTFELYYADGEIPSVSTVDGTGYGAFTSGGTVQAVDVSTSHLMFNGGVRLHYDDIDVPNVNTHMFQNTMEALIPLRERMLWDDTDFGETLSFGVSEHLSGITLHASTGRGAYKVEDLSRGNLIGYFHYSNTYAGILNAYELAMAGGYRFELGPMLWKQGEADGGAGTTRASYKTSMNTLRADFERSAEVATLTANGTFEMVSDQQGHSSTNYAEIAVALIELHRESAGIYCIGPSYGPECEYIATNDVHLTAKGYRNSGERFGLAIEEIRNGNPAPTTYITAASRVGTAITLTINVPDGPLVKDTTLVATVADDGFSYTGANITDVSITDTGLDGTGEITITIDADAGGSLRYAYANGTANNLGATAGARGNIRDSSANVTLYDATPLYNWLCVDEWVL